MAQTPAQRQSAYRQRRAEAGDNGERRLNTWISTGAALALKRLAAHHGISQRTILEQLILDADQAIIDSLRSNDDGFERYIEKALLHKPGESLPPPEIVGSQEAGHKKKQPGKVP